MVWFKNNRQLINFSLNKLYQALGVSKQNIHKQLKKNEEFKLKLADLIYKVDILRDEHPGCGVEKMYYTLKPDFVSRDKFIRIFMDLGYQALFPKNRIKTTHSVRSKYENLICGMLVIDINQVIQTDITYFMAGSQFYYIIFLIDVFSKRIVGYEVSDHMRAEANLKALKKVFKLRGKENLKNLIHHSDKGSQYTSLKYIEILILSGCSISMCKIAQKNAYAERINGTIKNEFLNHWEITSFSMLKKKLKKAVFYYNNKRPHNYLPNRLSPVQFEKEWAAKSEKSKHLELIYAEQNFHPRPHSRSVKKIKETTTTNFSHFCPLILN